MYSLDGNQIPTVKRKNKDVTTVAIAASVAGGFALLVIVAIIFVVTRRKQKSPEGMYDHQIETVSSLKLVRVYSVLLWFISFRTGISYYWYC